LTKLKFSHVWGRVVSTTRDSNQDVEAELEKVKLNLRVMDKL